MPLPGVNFTNFIRAAFKHADPKSAKKTVKLSSFWDLRALKMLKEHWWNCLLISIWSQIIRNEWSINISKSSLHCTLGGASSSVTWKEDSFDPVKSGLGPITQLEMPNLPVFAVDGLPHGTGFSLAVYAKNSKVININHPMLKVGLLIDSVF